MNSSPLVSVLMTAYNREKYIGTAIKSVQSSYLEDWELIIVDDTSTDETIRICEEFAELDSRIKVYQNSENLGDYPNRNEAAEQAKGKYIKYLDSDDIMYPHTLKVMVDAMERFPHCGFGLSAKMNDNKPHPYSLTPKEAYLEHFNGFGHFDRAPGSAIISKKTFDEIGGFTGERMIGDCEMWFRLARTNSMVVFPRDLYWARSHGEQESNTGYGSKSDMLRNKVMSAALENADCPLTSLEIDKIYKRLKANKFKKKLIKALSKLFHL